MTVKKGIVGIEYIGNILTEVCVKLVFEDGNVQRRRVSIQFPKIEAKDAMILIENSEKCDSRSRL